MTVLFGNAKYRFQDELSSRPERTRISCHAALDTAACASFRKEGRMKCNNATKSHRKSGVAKWRDLRCAPRASQILEFSRRLCRPCVTKGSHSLLSRGSWRKRPSFPKTWALALDFQPSRLTHGRGAHAAVLSAARQEIRVRSGLDDNSSWKRYLAFPNKIVIPSINRKALSSAEECVELR